jgi:hypothetical protein
MNRKLSLYAFMAIIALALCSLTMASDGPALSGSQKLLAVLRASDGLPGSFGAAVATRRCSREDEESPNSECAESDQTVVVGAPDFFSEAGAAYVFVEGPGGWGNMTQTAELTPSDATPGMMFGLSVAISGDTIVVGSFSNNAAYVFVKPKGGWQNMTETAILRASNNGIQDLFGATVAICEATIAVSAYQANFDQGRIDVFVEPKGGWVNGYPIGHLVTKDRTVDGYLGGSLAINQNTIVAGASGLTGIEGAAYVYVKPENGWKGEHTETAKLTPSDGAPSNFFGVSVDIARTGTVVAVGAENANNNYAGAAYVFVEPSGGWSNMTETAELTASNGKPNHFLGVSVAVQRGRVVAGAPTNGGNGAVYTFLEPASGWANETETTELKGVFGEFGSSFGVVGKTIVIGAPNLGAAYVFGP